MLPYWEAVWGPKSMFSILFDKNFVRTNSKHSTASRREACLGGSSVRNWVQNGRREEERSRLRNRVVSRSMLGVPMWTELETFRLAIFVFFVSENVRDLLGTFVCPLSKLSLDSVSDNGRDFRGTCFFSFFATIWEPFPVNVRYVRGTLS